MSFETKLWGSVALFCVAILLLFYFVVKSNREEREDCLNHGGRIADVHGGKGGWICTYDSKMERP